MFIAPVMALLLAVACDPVNNGDDSDKGKLTEGRYKDFEMLVSWDGNEVSFNQTGTYCAKIGNELLTKAGGYSFFTDSYTVTGDDVLTYTLRGLGTLVVNVKAGKVSFDFTVGGSGGSGKDLAAVVKKLATSGEDADVCRTWKVDKTAITYKVNSSPETSCDFVGLDFNEIEEYAAGKGLNMAKPLPAGMKVVYIAFMPDSKITIKFSNGDSFVADYSNLQISGFTHPYLQYLSGSGTAKLTGENLSFVIKANLNGAKKNTEATVYLILSKYVE